MFPTRKAPWSKHIELSIPVEHISQKTCDQLSVTAHVLYAMHQHCANLHCPNEGSWQVTRVIEIFPDHLGQWIPCISMDGAADFLPWICIGQWQPASETFDESKARSSAGRLAGEVHYRSVAPLGWWMWRLFFKACFVIIVCDCYFSNLDAMILWTCCLKQSSLSWIYEI